MPSFDYITAKEFRQSLEADHVEMCRCAEVRAWKGVQVLAGSIVESLLIDYVASTTHPTRPIKDPLKLILGRQSLFVEAKVFCPTELRTCVVSSDRTVILFIRGGWCA